MTFQEAMRATSRELSTRATITAPGFSFTATNEHIMGFTVDEGGVIPLGTASSARCTLDLANANNEWRRGGSLLGNRSLIGATVAIEIGVYHDGAWDWQPVATFIVDETKAREHDTRFILTGNDPLTRLDVKFNDTMRYTASTTLNDVLNHIKSKGVTINGTLAANGSAIIRYAPEWGDEPTIRQALCYVAQLGGSFVRCARNGSIELAPTNGATVHQINTSSYIDLTDEERVFLFNRIKLMPEGAKKDAVYVQSAVTSTPETAANTLVIEGNPIFKTRSTTSYYKVTGLFDQNKRYYELSAGKYSLVPFEERQEESLYRYYYASRKYNTSILQGIADGLKTALNGLNLRAASFRWRGDPSIKIGDKVTVTDTRGVSFTTTVLRQTFRFDQGFSAEISCPVELEGIAPFIMPAPHFGEGSIPGYAIAENSLVGAQFADGSITNSQIRGGTITGAEIADSTIKNSHFQDGTISGSIFEDGTITGSKIDTSTFTNGFISGTAIDTSTFTNGSISGSVIDTSTFVDGTIDGSKIKNSTMTDSVFADGEINASKIDASTFTNGSISGSAIDASKFTNGQISGSKINASTFTNGQISGSKIDSSTLTNIPYAQIKDLDVTGDAIFRQSVVGDGTFYLDKLIVNSTNIGTATIGELMVRDAQGKLHKVLIGANGVVSSEEVQMDGQNLSDDAMMQVSQRLVWRQATQPSAPFIGMIWMDTSLTPAGKPKEILKRCTAIAPSVVWEVVQSNELHTNVIDVDDNGMNILSGGNLNLLSGGAINIKNLSDTGNVINMDNTGLTLSSTGQLKLQSTDSIIIGGSPFSVGGTNLYTNDKAYYTYTEPGYSCPLTVNNRNAGDYLYGFNVTGPSNGINFLRVQNVISGNGPWTVSFDIRGSQSMSVPVTVTICDLGAKTVYTNDTNTFVRHSVTANVTNWSNDIYNFVDFENFGYAYYIIRNIKIEKGPVATDWSPAPQDTIDALDALDGRLGDVETRVQVFYQASKPTYTAVGDLWYDTDSNPLEVWKCTNVSTQAHSAFTDPVLTRALSAAQGASDAAAAAQGTANSKINTFVGSSTPSALAAGDLWLDTGNKNIWKRATAAGTGGWVEYLTASGYVNSTGITIDGTDLTVKATGNLNLAADANLNVQSGGNLNVLNGGDIEINSGGDINVASGGKITLTTPNDLVLGAQNITAFADGRISAAANTIDLSANNSIKLAVSGGTNLFTNSRHMTSTDTWSIYAEGAGVSLTASVNQYLFYKENCLTITPIPSNTYFYLKKTGFPNNFKVGDKYTLSFWARNNYPISAAISGEGGGIIIDFGWITDVKLVYDYTFLYTVTGTVTANAGTTPRLEMYCAYGEGTRNFTRFQLEKGPMATDWSPSPADPASGVKTSSVEVNTNGIYMDTTGDFNVNAGVNLSIKGGSGANSIGISNNPTDTYFMWAGNASAASAPFSVKRDGSVKATKIQHEYSQSFWDMADATFPAEFPVYIPSGYTIDSVLFTYQVKKARTFAKAAASGGGSTSGSGGGGTSVASETNVTGPVSYKNTSGPQPNETGSGGKAHTHDTNVQYTPGTFTSGAASATSHTHSLGNHYHTHEHNHSLNNHTHGIPSHTHSVPDHIHGINYGINEKTALATSSVLKVGATTIGTYAPNPGVVEIKAHMSANAWNTITVAPNNDARVVAYVLVKLTPL